MYYFEITQSWSSGRCLVIDCPAGYYCADTPMGTGTIISQAERIWEETDDGVTYIKNRLSWDQAVDMKEFAWIKLKAKSLRDIT